MSGDKTANKICRTRTVRESGGSSVVTIPPPMLEFTEFSEGQEVTLSAPVAGDEIIIQIE